MSATYEFILTDDSGRKFCLIEKYFFCSYSRTVQGYGAVQFGIPYDYYRKLVPDIFKPDWRLDIWRSPDTGFPLRREASFLLRKFNIYERQDGMRCIELFGRSPLDILRRGSLFSTYTRTGLADDVMVGIVTDATTIAGQLSTPSGEFTIGSSPGVGPTVDIKYQGYAVIDILTDIKNNTIILNNISPTTSHKIYFDVVEGDALSNGGFGYMFKVYADLRGQDRTKSGLIFSTDNGNLGKPSYYEDYLEHVTTITAIFDDDSTDSHFQSNEISLSRWSFIRKSIFNADLSGIYGYQSYVELYKGRGKKVFSADFLNTPGGPNQPRSIYGVDWDMGDLLRAEFADKAFDVEIKVVRVAVNENGEENIVGQTEIGASA